MKKYLVISPHPDDLDFGCAGTIAKLVMEGNQVEELIVSDGSKGSHVVGFSGKKLASMREQEQKNAAKVLGATKVHFLRHLDGEIENTKALRRKLVVAMRRIKPDVVISFDPSSINFENVYRSHRDHRMAAEMVFDAIYPALGSTAFFPELITQGLTPHFIEEIWFFATPHPNHIIDITDTFDIKLRALACHKSQVANFAAANERLRDRARETAKEYAKTKRITYAEAFRIMPGERKSG